MAGKLELIRDGGTSAVPKFNLPTSATKTKGYMLRPGESEYVQCVITDGGTGDTNNWGVRRITVYGNIVEREYDLDG